MNYYKMNYYKELKDFIAELKNSFFLSPKDRWFLEFLESEGYPLEVVKAGIKKFYMFYPPEKRGRIPLYFSFAEIKKLRQAHISKTSKASEDWKERFLKKLREAESVLNRKIEVEIPQDIARAEEILQELEREVAKEMWNSLSKDEKSELFKKFAIFKDNEELFKAMIKCEVFKMKGFKGLSLYIA